MSVEIEAAVGLELQGITEEIFQRSKTRYTRAFLLTCSELDICKQLPPGGFDPLVLRELEDAPREIHQSWRRSGDLSEKTCGNKTDCRSPRSIKGGACGQKIPPNSAASLGVLSSRPNAESNSHKNRNSDAPKCKAGVLDQSVKDTRKTGSYQLRKSGNPYRPPHCHQGGSIKFKDGSLSEESNSSKEINRTIQKETRPTASNISRDKDKVIRIPSVPVIEHTGKPVDLFLAKNFPSDSDNIAKLSEDALNSLEACVAQEHKVVDSDSCKINLSMKSRDSYKENSRMFLEEHMGSYLTARKCSSSTMIENAKPHLAANVESDMGYSPNQHICGIQNLRSILKNSSEKHSANLETREDDKLISNIELSELCCIRAHNSGQTGSDEWAKRIDHSKPCEFPFVDAFDFLTSRGDEGSIAARTHQTGIMAADVAVQTELYDMEDNELAFEDVWSEVSAIMRFEQEMDLTCATEYGQTTDFEIQVSLPNEDSVISIAYPSSCEPSEGKNCGNGAGSDDEICLPDENNCDSADSDADICLPNEDSLISIDHMIAPDSSSFKEHKNLVKDDTLTSNPTDGVARRPVKVDISRHKKRSAPRHSSVLPFHDAKASSAHQELHFQQTYLQSPWTGTTVAIPPLLPFDYRQALMSAQMPKEVPLAPYPYSAVNWYSSTNMHHQPSPKECDSLVQYSLQQQPTAFPGQDLELPISVAPFYPHVNQVAWCNLGFDMIQTHPVSFFSH